MSNILPVTFRETRKRLIREKLERIENKVDYRCENDVKILTEMLEFLEK